jgi:Ca2+-dependent lipid-binding protein
MIGLSDPFLVMKAGKRTLFQSSIKSETLNPIWNETFELPFTPGMPEEIKLVVLDHDLSKPNDFLGEARLNLSHIIQEGFSGWLSLESVEKGELHLEAEYVPPDVDDGKELFLCRNRNMFFDRKRSYGLIYNEIAASISSSLLSTLQNSQGKRRN